jgi:hypothetical protein
LAKEKAVVAYDRDDNIVYEFESALKAFENTGINRNSIGLCARHHTKTAGDFRWEFKDPVEKSIIDEIRPR